MLTALVFFGGAVLVLGGAGQYANNFRTIGAFLFGVSVVAAGIGCIFASVQ